MRETPLQRASQRQSWPAQPLTVDGFTTNQLLFSGPCLYRGFSIGNQNASAVTIEVYDGLDTKGSPIGFIALPAAASDRLWIGSPGVSVEEGLFITVSAGPLKGAFYYTPLDDIELNRLLDREQAGKDAAKDGKGNPALHGNGPGWDNAGRAAGH